MQRATYNKKYRKIKYFAFSIFVVIAIIYGTLYFVVSEEFIRDKVLATIQNQIQANISVEQIEIEYFFIPSVKLNNVHIGKIDPKQSNYAIIKQINIKPQITKFLLGDFNAIYLSAKNAQIFIGNDIKKLNIENIKLNAAILQEKAKKQIYQLKGFVHAYEQKLFFEAKIKQNHSLKLEAEIKNYNGEKITQKSKNNNPNIKIETKLELDTKQNILNIKKLKVNVGKTNFNAKINWQNAQTKQLNAQINIQEIYLEQFISNIKKFIPEKVTRQDYNNNQDIAEQKQQKTKVNLKIYADSIIINNKNLIQKLNANIIAQFRGRQMNNYHIKVKKAEIYEGNIVADIRNKNQYIDNQDTGSIGEIIAKNINVEKLTQNTIYQNILTGNADADIYINFSNKNLDEIIQNADAEVMFHIKDGYLIHQATKKILHKVRNIAKKINVAGPPGNNIKFNDIKGELKLKKDFVYIKADIKNDILNINTKINLNRNTQNIQLDNKIAFWPDANGVAKWNIPFKMNGNTQNLQNFEIDINSLQELKAEVTQTRKKLQKIQKIYKNKLKEFSTKNKLKK